MLAAVVCGGVFAFSSERWLAERNDDSDVVRLRDAFLACKAKMTQPALDVVFPIEHYPNGTVKSRLKAREAQLFMDTGFILGMGIRVEEYDIEGKVCGWLEADDCIVDRNTLTGWVQGNAVLNSSDTMVRGRGVYFSFHREFIKILSQSEIRAKGLKANARSLL